MCTSIVCRLSEPWNPREYSCYNLMKKIDTLEKKLRQTSSELGTITQRQSGISTLLDERPSFYHEKSFTVDELESGGWKMVFRATSGNGQSVYDAWVKGTGTSDVKPLTMSRSLSSHYRDPAIDTWHNLAVKYVKFALYKGNREVAYVIFNGSGSSNMGWFTSSRVLMSSWPGLTSNVQYNIFSVDGHANGSTLMRRFHINKSYAGCDNDRGYVAVIDGGSACAWDQHPSYPQFIYSDMNSDDFYNRRQFGLADYVVVFVYI
ncbi:uncharacterized protein LOC127853659 isoform X2 [Dreissena polymorpha]|uniref:uncharacterized protein LOC127853659 isoform X2 n=1 Tax=Dreissena polymorpha TaxID=45954 RepID=UPI002264AEF9|nr:uncharacterized protein LOC127853659 isoform X2 [Dreissena polymorpha]